MTDATTQRDIVERATAAADAWDKLRGNGEWPEYYEAGFGLSGVVRELVAEVTALRGRAMQAIHQQHDRDMDHARQMADLEKKMNNALADKEVEIERLRGRLEKATGVDAFGWKKIPFGYNFWSPDVVFNARISFDYGDGVQWWAAKHNADGDLIDGSDVTNADSVAEAKQAAESWLRQHGYDADGGRGAEAGEGGANGD